MNLDLDLALYFVLLISIYQQKSAVVEITAKKKKHSCGVILMCWKKIKSLFVAFPITIVISIFLVDESFFGKQYHRAK